MELFVYILPIFNSIIKSLSDQNTQSLEKEEDLKSTTKEKMLMPKEFI